MKHTDNTKRKYTRIYKPCFEDLIKLKNLTKKRDDKMSTNFHLNDMSNAIFNKKYNLQASEEHKHALNVVIRILGLIFKDDFVFLTTCERGKKWRFKFNNISKIEFEYKLSKFFEKTNIVDYESESHMANFFKKFLSYAIYTEKCLFSLPCISFATLGLGINVKSLISNRKSKLKDFMNRYGIVIKIFNFILTGIINRFLIWAVSLNNNFSIWKVSACTTSNLCN